MQFERLGQHSPSDITTLFTHVFSDSEGANAGLQIGALTDQMQRECNSDELMPFIAHQQGTLFAAVFFSQLYFKHSSKVKAMILSPMAVASSQQGKGIGQGLINFALNDLKAYGVDFVATYGDPKFYSKTGFEPMSDHQLIPPFALSFPHGWQAVSLTGKALSELVGEISCVAPLNQAEYW